MEACLKLKEVSYIHSEAYQGGELKHGSIALIDDNTPLICLVTEEDLVEKTISNIIETKSRGAKVYIFKKENINIDESVADYTVNVPNVNEFLLPIIFVVPFQMLAYYVALEKGLDIDKPKNLAKSVTVE